MTSKELYERANTGMTMCYETGKRCMETSTTNKETRFYRDFTQGEIEAISDFAMSMYLGMFFDFESKDPAEEERTYINFCIKLRERAKTLKDLIGDYAMKFL